ncbi:hypothetical protein ELOC111193_15850 [Elizabethkingia occulta]|uniref:Lipoprotein n=1 Tax=Elizabethkingia occulta TaxID=1867263 RepID=A0A1T3MWM0_9FLAO|nr:hypothetical protein [Elizabethkingia occulta]OPB92507.1 hypothetical protein BB020_07825 [Elizabethkingia occulta]OPC68978.1 hypothetical protein BAZ10_00075 [Elizabethkingia occulta]
MKIKVFFLYIFILITCVSCKQMPAQSATVSPPPNWLAKSYKNVIMIEGEDMVKLGENYLVDIPVQEKPDSVYVFFLNADIPVERLKKPNSFYPFINEFILIVPDRKYYKIIAEEAYKQGIIIEPLVTNNYYHITRNGGEVKTDSTHISGNGQPQISYAEPEVPKDMLQVYYTDSYGSVCCPRDPKWDSKQDDASFIKEYEQNKKVKIRDTYSQNNGKEGEHAVYYTLSGLTSLQRLGFILEKESQRIKNRETKDIQFSAQLFTPHLVKIEKEGFRKMTKLN